MAGHTGLGENRVINCCANPGCRNVAAITAGCCGDMRGTQTGGNHAIVTRLASTSDLCVINAQCWRPNIRRVASFAHIACVDVRRTFAG